VKSNQRNTQEKLAATSCTINLQQPKSFSSVAGMKPTDGDGRRKKHFSPELRITIPITEVFEYKNQNFAV